MRALPILVTLVLFGACAQAESADSGPDVSEGGVVVDSVTSEAVTFRVVELVGDLENAWGMDWLPDGRVLVTERKGRMLLVDEDSVVELGGVPEVWAKNQGGLLDVRVSPQYDLDGEVWFTWSKREGGVGGTVVSKARLDGSELVDVQEVYRQTPFLEPDYHFGSRIVFPDETTVVIALGERGERREQTLGLPNAGTSVGAVVRLNRDGSVPSDNPFVDGGGLAEVWSYGHRNPQAMAIQESTGRLWVGEHGPHGGDELNLVEPGANYGWPAVSYGDTYSTPHEAIGGTEGPGITDPVHYWDPSPGLSGMDFYDGEVFPEWRGDLFIGSLALVKLMRLEMDDSGAVTHQEDLLQGSVGRIRDVATGPDGYLYLLTDAESGGLFRLEPVEG